jgi:hypothetical protein
MGRQRGQRPDHPVDRRGRGSVTFTFDRAFTPAELATMAEEALEWVNTLVDPENPPLDVPRYNRLHPTFRKAVL